MEIEYKNQFNDKFDDIPNGEIFMADDYNLFIKIQKIHTCSNTNVFVNAIYLKDGKYDYFHNDAKVIWLKDAKLITNI